MNVLILGIDGYLGWPLALYLAERGHVVSGLDAFYRRGWVEDMGSYSAIPICSMSDRLDAFEEHFNYRPAMYGGDVQNYEMVMLALRETRPDAIVHLAEMPSAPWSMIDVDHAVETHSINVNGTLNLLFAMRDEAPQAHLVKLGTMGEYGTPGIDIPEGFFEIGYRGRRDRLPFPRQAGSFYHLTKVHDTHNMIFSCGIWGLRATDIMQGVVFGTRIDEMGDDPRLTTRLDFDESFGTCVNRYCCMAVIGHPLTPFGKGQQRRGFLPLRDSMQCLTLALENPAREGEYRTFNQFQEVFSVTELARKVQMVALGAGLNIKIENLENLRIEAEEHYYNPDCNYLPALGYQPSDVMAELRLMIADLLQHRERIERKRDVLVPEIHWTGEKKKAVYL